MAIIEKKIWPEFFEKILNGEKTFEIRLADFEVKPKDVLLLKEWDPEKKEYTGRELKVEVSYVTNTKIAEKFWDKKDIDEKGLWIIGLKKAIDFDEYQRKARTTAIYPNKGKNLIYPVLGLAGETGEVVEKVKKLMRDKDMKIDQEFLDYVKKELGDVLWYIAAICSELGLSMSEVAEHNLSKLFSRKERNVLHGEGDLR